MKYRLKDQDLQAKLDEISGGDFSKRLEEVDPNINVPRSEGGIYVSFGKIQFGAGFSDGQGHFRQYQIAILFKDLILEKTYDPHSWNEWPEVTPPEGVLMRLEYVDKCGAKRKTCAMVSRKMCGIVSKGVWTNFDGYEIDIDKGRFRPWEEE